MGQCLSVHVVEPLIGANGKLWLPTKEQGITLSEAQSISRLRTGTKTTGSTGITSGTALPQNRGRRDQANKFQLLVKGNYSHVDVTVDSKSGTLTPLSPTQSEQTHPMTPASTACISPAPETPQSNLPNSPLSSLIAPLSSIRNSFVSPLSMGSAGTTGSDFHSPYMSTSLMASPSFLLDGLDRIVIPEEVDPDAPSDEEDSYNRVIEETQDPNAISEWEMEPGPIRSSHRSSPAKNSNRPRSPPRPMAAVKARHQRRVARPTSIVRHHPHISPPPHSPVTHPPNEPPGAVDRHTLADFNKLQIQVQLHDKSNKQTRRLQKLEDRLKDVQSYRKLFKEFEHIQDAVSVSSQQSEGDAMTRLHRTDSFDLKESSSWYFDFELADRPADFSDLDDDDAQSLTSQFSQQSQLSLLSESSMDSQRKYYAAKKHTTSTKKRIEKLEQLLKQMNERKKQGASASAAGEATPKEAEVNDYGPRERRGSFCSYASSTADYGPAVRRGSNASKTSMKSDCGHAATNGAFPIHVTTRDDYGPAKRRGSGTSQVSMLSDSTSLYRQVQPRPVENDNDDDNESQCDPCPSDGSHGSSTQSPRSARRLDLSKAIMATVDVEATPKRSGHTSVGRVLVEPLSVTKLMLSTPTKQQQQQALGTPQGSTLETPSQESPASTTVCSPKMKTSPCASPDSPATSMEEKKCDEDKKDGGSVPLWRSFLNLSPFPSDKSKSNNPPSPASESKVTSRPEDTSIYSMSKHEFLQIAEDQFEDLKVVRIFKEENADEGTILHARRLDFSDVQSDATATPGEQIAALSTIEGE